MRFHQCFVNPLASNNLNKCYEQCLSFNSITGICGIPNAHYNLNPIRVDEGV